LASHQVQLPDDEGLISELLTLEARPTRSGQTYIGASSGAKDDRASVIAALMDSTAPSTRMTPNAATKWRELLADLGSLSTGRRLTLLPGHRHPRLELRTRPH
jgi:hypothetical protein